MLHKYPNGQRPLFGRTGRCVVCDQRGRNSVTKLLGSVEPGVTVMRIRR
jgi:hypothetical protein